MCVKVYSKSNKDSAAVVSRKATSSVNHGRVSAMAWAGIAASGTGSPVFIGNVTADRSSTMNTKEY